MYVKCYDQAPCILFHSVDKQIIHVYVRKSLERHRFTHRHPRIPAPLVNMFEKYCHRDVTVVNIFEMTAARWHLITSYNHN